MSLILGTSGIISVLTGFIGGLLYPMFSIIFLLIQAVQNFFFVFAGIGSASFNGEPINSGLTGEETDQGLIYYLMQNDLVVNMLFSIMMLALFLIIIFTVMAFIKNAYAAKPKGWKEIVGSAIKGLANFVFLPVCCLLGVWLGNILLKAINGATSGGGAYYMDRKLFIAAAYNSNEFRNGDENAVADPSKVQELRDFINTFGSTKELFGATKDENGKLQDIENLPDGKTNAYYADLVDYIYANSKVSIYEWGMVEKWYSLFEINYLVLIVGGVFMLYVLGSLTFAMIRRMFYILVLFIISPGVCAMYPLDDGKAVGSWKSEFIKQVLSAYGAVAGMNIFFSLMPLIDKIQLSWWAFGINEIIQIFIMVCGLLIVKDLIGLLSGFVGGEDAYSKGSALMKSASKEIAGKSKKVVGFGVGVGGAFVRANAARKAAGDADGGKAWWSSMGKTLKNVRDDAIKKLSGGAVDKEAIEKSFESATKEGRSQGGLIKQSADFASRYKAANDTMNKAQSDYDKAKATYDSKKNAGTATKTDEKAVVDAERSLNRASLDYWTTLDQAPEGVKEKIYGKLAKEKGPNETAQTMEEQVKRERQFFADKFEYDEAQYKKEQIARDLNGKETRINTIARRRGSGADVVAAMEEVFGKGIADAMSAMGMDIMNKDHRAKIFEMRRDGTTIDANSVQIQNAGIDARAGALAFNRNLEKEQDLINKFDDSIKKFADTIVDYASGMKNSDGTVKFDDAALQAMKQAIKEGNSNVNVSDVMAAVQKSTDDSNKVIQKMLKDSEAIRKLLEEIKKNKDKK